ncbi:MAG TPA: hypothetical protein VGF86_07935 [Candidatus Tumulicola sp.]|jgi:hypothetical protein
MTPTQDSCSCFTRRRFVSAHGVIAGAASPAQQAGKTYNGSSDAFRLRWLDKFGGHHQAEGTPTVSHGNPIALNIEGQRCDHRG